MPVLHKKWTKKHPKPRRPVPTRDHNPARDYLKQEVAVVGVQDVLPDRSDERQRVEQRKLPEEVRSAQPDPIPTYDPRITEVADGNPRVPINNASTKEHRYPTSLDPHAADERPWAHRRFRELMNGYVKAKGGMSKLTEPELTVVRQAAFYALNAELLQKDLVAMIVSDEPQDIKTRWSRKMVSYQLAYADACVSRLVKLGLIARGVGRGVDVPRKPRPGDPATAGSGDDVLDIKDIVSLDVLQGKQKG